QGALAPRAYEQLAILALLVEDPDAEVRATAEATLSKIPESALKSFLARADVPIDLREFFADRGVFPDEIPQLEIEGALDVEEPLLDTDASLLGDEGEDRETSSQKLATMGLCERRKATGQGDGGRRAIIARPT